MTFSPLDKPHSCPLLQTRHRCKPGDSGKLKYGDLCRGGGGGGGGGGGAGGRRDKGEHGGDDEEDPYKHQHELCKCNNCKVCLLLSTQQLSRQLAVQEGVNPQRCKLCGDDMTEAEIEKANEYAKKQRDRDAKVGAPQKSRSRKWTGGGSGCDRTGSGMRRSGRRRRRRRPRPRPSTRPI